MALMYFMETPIVLAISLASYILNGSASGDSPPFFRDEFCAFMRPFVRPHAPPDGRGKRRKLNPPNPAIAFLRMKVFSNLLTLPMPRKPLVAHQELEDFIAAKPQRRAEAEMG